MSVTAAQAAEWFENRAATTPMPGARGMFEIAAAALREKAERENPQPLPVGELWRFEDNPVYLVSPKFHIREWNILVFAGDVFAEFKNGRRFYIEDYGATWTVYRRKPKEGGNA